MQNSLKTFLMLFACAVPFPFLPQILYALQSSVTACSAALLTPLGIVRETQGNLVILGNGESIFVAEACSGYKSILIFFTLTLLASCLLNFKPKERWLMLALSLPCAWTLNLVRVACVLTIGNVWGAGRAFAVWEFSAGIFFYMIGMISMAGIFLTLKKHLRGALLILPAFIFISVCRLSAGQNYTDTSAYTFTSHEGRWQTVSDLFHQSNMSRLPMRLGSWNGVNVPISDPLPFYLRRYRHDKTKTYLYLQPVYGREETAFHTAEVCYINAGWKMDERGYKTLSVRGQNLQVRYATAIFGNHRHLVLYWYAWPASRRAITDGCLMFRISVEIQGSESAALELASDFISEMSRAQFGTASAEVQKIPKPDLSVWKATIKSSISKSQTLPPELSHKRDLALSWILGQLVPNGVVRKPSGERRNLILSYRSDPSSPDYKYVFSKSALYDNALAAIALTISGHEARAADILSTVERISDENGDLFFSFNTHNSWPNAKDFDGAVVRTGASAWAGYAACFHLAYRLMKDPNLFTTDRGALQILKFAETTANALMKRQVTAEGDIRKGLVTGGKGSYTLRVKDGKVTEEFVNGEVTWCSVEHNIDVYFFLTALGRVSGDAKWTQKADEVKAALISSCWNPRLKQFNRGINILQADRSEALDCASWGSAALLSFGETEKAAAALKSMVKFKSRDSGRWGFKPYSSGTVYEEPAAQKHFFPDGNSGLWQNIGMVWPEGTLGAGLACWKGGDRNQALAILNEIGKLQDETGGIAYATRQYKFQFSTSPSAASAGWFLILAGVLEDPIADALFWDR